MNPSTQTGYLSARPLKPNHSNKLGLYPLNLDKTRDGLVFIPVSYHPAQPAPFILMLHGAGSNSQAGITPFLPLAESQGLILLAIDSRRQTWDRLRGTFSVDLAFMDLALSQVLSNYNIDSSHLAIAGFSDGATYALSVGLTNGNLFSHIMAFSPGFMAPAGLCGTPRLFISHGTEDQVLPIQSCSRRIVPQIQQAGYEIVYQEFPGGHTIPPHIVLNVLKWFKPPSS
ncbi:Phospholipase/Carboxylesterase [Planktothrix tepida]|uniref:Phospholipase/Carboxylesterase n=2 Tax=Planktothrix TaxID=54304 RepID=A0A1J1LFW0_9CYAN